MSASLPLVRTAVLALCSSPAFASSSALAPCEHRTPTSPERQVSVAAAARNGATSPGRTTDPAHCSPLEERTWLAGVSRRIWVPGHESTRVTAHGTHRQVRDGRYVWIHEPGRFEDERASASSRSAESLRP